MQRSMIVLALAFLLTGCACGTETGVEFVSPVRFNQYASTSAGVRQVMGPPVAYTPVIQAPAGCTTGLPMGYAPAAR